MYRWGNQGPDLLKTRPSRSLFCSPDDLYQPLNKAMNMFFQESSPCLGQTPKRHPQGIQTETWAPNLSLLKPLHFHCSCWLRSCARGARTFILPVTLQENSQPFCLAVKVSPAPIRQPSCPFLAKNGQHLPPPWHPELHSLWLKFHVLYPVFTMSSSA